MWDWLWGKRESVHEKIGRLESEIKQIDENLKMLEDQPAPDVPLEKVEVPVEKPPDPVPEPVKEPTGWEHPIDKYRREMKLWLDSMILRGFGLPKFEIVWEPDAQKSIEELQPKEKPMSVKKMEIARLVDLLKTFVAKAGTLHPEQQDRLDGVQNGLEDMLQDEEEKTDYVIYWKEAQCWLAGYGATGEPLWSRDWKDGQAFDSRTVKEVFEKIDADAPIGMTVAIQEDSSDGPKVEPKKKPKPEPKTETANIKSYFVVYHAKNSGYWSVQLNKWSELRNAGEFKDLVSARAWALSYSLHSAEVHEIERTDTSEASRTVTSKCVIKSRTPVTPEAKAECGLKEIPKDEKRYGIRFKEDGYIVKTPDDKGLFPWIWNPLASRDARRFTLEEAKTFLKEFTGKPNVLSGLIDQKFLGVVEISEDYSTITPVDGWSKPVSEKRYGVKLNDRAFLCNYPKTQEPMGWSWVTLTMSHKPAKLTLDEAKTALKRYLTEPNQLRDQWAKPENPCVVEFSEDGKTFTPVKEKKYRVRLSDGDAFVFRNDRWCWTKEDGWGKADQKPTLYATREEAEKVITEIKEKSLYGYVNGLSPRVEEVDA